MKFTPKSVNLFTLIKLPSAYLSGVRLKSIDDQSSKVQVKFRWINKNPFKSMFWAVQGMAAELSTGILVMKHISQSNKRVSMLVTNMSANFSKKARGRITFDCTDGDLIKEAIKKAVATGQGQAFTVVSKGVDQSNEVVSTFEFEWSVKVKG